MSRIVEHYFSLVSPWAYLGFKPLMALAAEHGLTVAHKPVLLGRVFDQTGGLPLAKRHPARQRYRHLELQRWRERRGVSFTLQPKHWPFDATLADRMAIGAVHRGEADAFLAKAFPAVWEEERDLADPAVLRAIAQEAGLDADALMTLAEGSATEAVYVLNLENAVEADVFGSPSYVIDGEVFWGQDRLELLGAMLASGRSAYSA